MPSPGEHKTVQARILAHTGLCFDQPKPLRRHEPEFSRSRLHELPDRSEGTPIQAARIQAGWAVNRELVMLYWDIGRGIVEKQQTAGWGEAVVERLAADLRAEFPGMTSFSADNVWRMRQFYTEYSAPEFLEQAVQELEWGTGMAFLGQPVPEIGGNTKNSILGQAVPEILAQAERELVSRVPRGHDDQLMKKL